MPTNLSLSSYLYQRLQQRREQGLYRGRVAHHGPQGPYLRLDGRTLLGFCSNDYLGLAAHPALRQALREGASRYGVGAGASHLVNGHSIAHQRLEHALAEYTGREAALLFSTGYMANLGVIDALLERRDASFMDKLNHASLIDGGLLARAELQRYRHADPAHLDELLGRSSARHQLVVSDGVFSMDGDLAPLPELARVAQTHHAWLMLDDAHGLGVLGTSGGGCCEHFGLGQAEVPILVGTLGKAFGVGGAFVAGSAELVDYLLQFARSAVYTTAPPPALACAALAALRVSRQETWRRDKVMELVQLFRAGAAARGIPLGVSPTPIQPVLVGDSARALALSAALRQRGLLVTAIRPPTVPAGSARLRVTLSATHNPAQVRYLLESLAEALHG